MLIRPIDYFLVVWFALAALSTAYVAYDQFKNNPEPLVMKWGFVLITLYMGPLGLLMYVMADKEPYEGAHEEFIKPLWKQGIGSTIHCVAGDATGIIFAATITALLGLPMWVDVIIEYLAGFLFGLLIFQSLFMKSLMGGSYFQNVRKSFMPEFISMNAMMAGMAPVMILLMMGRDMRAMDPSELIFWGVMSLGVAIGFLIAYPVNLWMVAQKMKHGLMTERSGGRSMASAGKTASAAVEGGAATSGRKAKSASKAAPMSMDHASMQHGDDSGKSEDKLSTAKGLSKKDPIDHASMGTTGANLMKPVHPIFVHFPIALLVLSVAADVLALLVAQDALQAVAVWALLGAAIGGVVTVLAGIYDMNRAQLAHTTHQRVHRHMKVGFALAAAIPLLAVWRWMIYLEDGFELGGFYLLTAFLVLGLAAFQGWLGGELVYTYGVGVDLRDANAVSQSADAHAEHGKKQATVAVGIESAPMKMMPAANQDGAKDMPPMDHAAMKGGSKGTEAKGGHGDMRSNLTKPQLASVALITFLMLAAGMVLPSFSVNMALSLRDVGGAIMPPARHDHDLRYACGSDARYGGSQA